MGKLLALELYNFKSYKGHHVLQFGDSYFTSIIGPNGSGKSNSMDAISFVLGIKSSHLRSTHLKDLVYRGRVLKHSKINADGTATDDAPNGHANGGAAGGGDEVDEEIVDTQASSQRNDPQTAWVMAVYEDDAGDEQRWKRSITANGQSEYRINSKSVTAKVYNESLETENILIKARNFLVFQGDVEAIASQSPKDLTRLIEQISGSLEHKAEYERLKAVKEQATDEHTYKVSQRRGINGEVELYKKQKEELDKYEQTREERDDAVVTHILWKLFHFQRTIEDSTAEIQKYQAELKEFRRNVQKFKDRLDVASTESTKARHEVDKCKREIKRKEKEVEEKENELVPVDEKLSIHTANAKKYDDRIKDIAKERDLQQQSTNKMQKDLQTVQTAQKRWEKEWHAQQQKAGRQLSDQDLQEKERLTKEVYKRTGADQSKVDTISRQLRADEETVNSLKSSLESIEKTSSNLEEEVNGLNQRRSDIQHTMESRSEEIKTKEVTINVSTSDRERTEQKRRELEEKLHMALTKLNEARGAERESRREQELRNQVSTLKRIYPGVKNTLGSLCRPKQKKFEAAVSTVLGRHFDSIVVDSQQTAEACIKHLREGRIGQATFIPLDTIIHKQPNANLRGLHQGTRLAIDTIDYDTSLERAMSFACGNAIVTDTLVIAKNLIYNRNVNAKAVTLDGTIIHKGGNMTGGAGLHDKKRRFENVNTEGPQAMVDKYRAEIETLPKGHKRQAQEESLRVEVMGLEAKLKYAREELKTLDRNIESKSRELQHVKSQLAELKPKYEEQALGVDTLRQTLEQHTAAVAEVEDEIFGAFCQRLGYENIREYERQQGTLQEEAREKEREFKSQISRLSNQLEFEKNRLQSTETRLKTAHAQGKRDKDAVATLQAQRAEVQRDLTMINDQIDELNAQLEDLQSEYQERQKKVDEARNEYNQKSRGEEKTVKEISALGIEVQKANSQRYSQLRYCKVENISLPLERGSRTLDVLPMEEEALEEDEDSMDVDEDEGDSALKVNDYGIHVSYDNLDDDLKDDDSDECETSLHETIRKLDSSLEKMAPNMRSAERLEATSARQQAFEIERKEAEKAKKKADKDFEEIKSKRQAAFNKAYKHISEQIGSVYKELTKTQAFPLGGSASLDVEEDDEPYLAGVKYHAMPPLKRFRDMEHLSGGEKTMAALALLFAVHTYAPSPFFVLDEVDAALDHANTTQLAQYVKEHAGPGMQFVVISLKTGLFQNSETLVGIMRDQAVNSSRALTLDLRRYQPA